MTCPIKKGLYSLTKQVEIPNEVPPGKYTVFARAYNDDDTMITCLTGSIVFPAAAATTDADADADADANAVFDTVFDAAFDAAFDVDALL